MTQQLENRLRAAFRDKAGQIPAVAPPLELASRPRRATRPAGTRGLGRLLTPGQLRLVAGLAAVAAVAAIAVATAVASSQSTPPPRPPAGGFAAKPPPYYVAISFDAARHQIAVVRATSTGAVIASIRAPRPYADFVGVTGAADDRSFVLLATGTPGSATPDRFYLLRIDPAARLAASRTQLTPLGVRLPRGSTGLVGMALSPDGRSLAIVAFFGPATANRLVIYDLATGASHSWADRGCQDNCISGQGVVANELNSISWTADGRQLGFVELTGVARLPQFRLLSVNAPGGNALADSRPVNLRAAPGALQGMAPHDTLWPSWLITPNGRSIIVDAQTPVGGSDQSSAPTRPAQLLRYSARTGALQAVVGIPPATAGLGLAQVMWSSPDGSTILTIGFRDSHSAGLLHDGRYTPIPWSAQLLSAAW